jgi:glycosyltransferase involved in cell wall biosynthesis
MNILQVVESCSAGVGRHVRGLCQDLIAEGHQLTLAYAPDRTDEAFRQFMADRQNAIRFVPLSTGREISPVSDLRAIVQLLRLIRREGPFDIVHGHSSKGGALARIAARCFGVPTIYTPHSLIMSSPEISRAEAVFYTLIERVLGQWATSRIIAVSEREYELILRLRLVPEDRVAMVENGIDDQDFQYFSEISREVAGKKPLIFGSTMRFSSQKAPGHLIKAFARLVKMSPRVPVRLVIAGDGELFAEAKKQVAATGLGEKISLLGWRTEVREVLRELDVFVVSSLYEAGLSYSTMEAMAAKLPVISTNVFGTKETVARVPGNVLVPVGDPQALAHAMYQFTTPTEGESIRRSLQRIGQANRDYVRARFGRSEATNRILEIYQTLC